MDEELKLLQRLETSLEQTRISTSTWENGKDSNIITILKKRGEYFPVYWTHFVSWHVIVRENIDLLRQEWLNWEECSTMSTDISSEDIEWTKFCIDLIQGVNRKSEGT